ncbi:MAG TPA: YceI family protein [Thermoanaerobaculia bacterium]
MRTILLAVFLTATSLPADPLTIDRDRSWILAITGRAGLLAELGHDHAILAREWTATINADRENIEKSTVDLTIKTSSLVIDTPEARQKSELKTPVPTGGLRTELQQDLLSSYYLGARKHPTIEYKTHAVRKEGEHDFTLVGTLTLRGSDRQTDIPVKWQNLPDGTYLFQGSVFVNHTDFGMKPQSLAGVVKVADPIEIRFTIYAR